MPVARLIALSPVFALAVLFGVHATDARAQDATVMIGSPGGSGITVDLSVLDDFGRPQDGGDGLRFPGSAVGPEDTVRLHPPGAKPALKRPTRKKPRRAKKKRTAPKPKPAAVAAAPAEAPPPAPKMTAEAPPPPPPPPAPAPEAKAPPRPVTPPPPAPALSRSDVPAPPPAMKPDLPPITPAPRTAVDQTKIAPPQQTAALPKPPAGGTAFKVGTAHAIAFGAGSASLPDDAAATLKAAADLLKADSSLRVQIKAYAAGEKDNESKARRLSLSRALGVRSILIKEGVQPTRIDVRALGSQVPDGAPDRVDLSVVAR